MDTLAESAPDPRLQGPHERPGEGQGQITELVACPEVRIAGDTANAPSECRVCQWVGHIGEYSVCKGLQRFLSTEILATSHRVQA